MKVTETFKAENAEAWRAWLEKYGDEKSEIWLLFDDREQVKTVSYLDSVEQAICFGWIDGIQKRINEYEKAQRFTPRKRRSNWTELNKARARRLRHMGKMTARGEATLPDLDAEFVVPSYVAEAVEADQRASSHFSKLPPLYVRVRVGYIDEMRRNPIELEKRLRNFVRKTAEGKLFGNWNDGGRLGDDA